MSRLLIDVTGDKKGEWTAIRREGKHPDGTPTWLIRCSCGTESHVKLGTWRNKLSKKCKYHSLNMLLKDQGKNFENIIGAKVNDLTILSDTYAKGHYRWVDVVCDCGTKDTVKITDLMNERRTCCRVCAQKKGHIEASEKRTIHRKRKRNGEKITPLHEVVEKAREKGLSYGKMQAMEYLQKKIAL